MDFYFLDRRYINTIDCGYIHLTNTNKTVTTTYNLRRIPFRYLYITILCYFLCIVFLNSFIVISLNKFSSIFSNPLFFFTFNVCLLVCKYFFNITSLYLSNTITTNGNKLVTANFCIVISFHL